MKKKIVFFDADGTLWYPKKTRHEKHPVWIWREKGHNLDEVIRELTLVPKARETLKSLIKKDLILVVLSTSPFPSEVAKKRIFRVLRNFKIEKYFLDVHGTKEIKSSKGAYILKLLKKYKLSKEDALMVGDSFEWDYQPARDVRIDAILIDSKYHGIKKKGNRIKIIKKLNDLVKLIDKNEKH